MVIYPTLRNIHKIAILRASALGDFVVTLPALQAIRTAYPLAEIVLLGKPWHETFVSNGRTPIDRVVIVPIKKGIRTELNKAENEEEIAAFINLMRDENFDIVINMHGNGVSSNPFIKKFNAKVTAGLVCSQSEKLDLSLDFFYYQSEVIRYLEVAALIGATNFGLEPQLSILPRDNEEVSEFLATLENTPYIVLHPVAMDIRRMWPVENYARLADELKQRNLEVVFTGATEDRKIVDDIIYDMHETAINACGDFSLGGLAAVLSKAVLMISADTGPLHLARALSVPTIGFYWAPNLINWGPLTRTLHRPLVSWNMTCPLCGIVPNDPYPFEPHTQGCDHAISFTRDISLAQVLKSVDELLQVVPAKEHEISTGLLM